MTEAVFVTTLNELGSLGVRLRRVSLNHYNEPFLDPHICDRIAMVADCPFVGLVLLNTNLSATADAMIHRLIPLRERIEFNVNLPTTDRLAYLALHGRDHFGRVMHALRALAALGFSVRVNVQRSVLAVGPFDRDSLPTSVRVEVIESRSRAGMVNPLAPPSVTSSRLSGCRINRPRRFVHVGVDGSIFFCCEDYSQQYVIGRLGDQTLHEILASAKMNEYLAFLDGSVDAPNDFICRSCEFAVPIVPRTETFDAGFTVSS
jgi:radical SAM protein with 4Fe4S-binding SPASM domain